MELNDITKKLRRLHRDREPLNLAAAKRNHPELVEAVYKLRPFLGWRGAIEAAGLSYGDLLVELLETIPCQLCGTRFKYKFPAIIMKKNIVYFEKYKFPAIIKYKFPAIIMKKNIAYFENPATLSS